MKPDATWVKLNLARYIGHRVHLEFVPDKDASMKVYRAIQGSKAEVQQTISEIEKIETTNHASWNAFHQSVDEAIGERLMQVANSWSKSRRKLQSKIIKRSRSAMAMMDGSGEEAHVYIRGNPANPGERVPRRFLSALAGTEPMGIRSSSGRLELAQHINDPNNPLTARVIVNRVWHWLMGRGIVPTPDDLGVLGQRPTHPQLLDHLATRFLHEGRSIKGLIRSIVLSQTYRMSSQSDPQAVAADPDNKLWHHRPPKRLEGEAIRDALLSIAGRLDPGLGGEPVPIHLTSFMQGRGRPRLSGPRDGDGRRSVYIAVRRNFLSPFMLAFDTPAPFSSMGKRNVSNVPAQSLILMNDPFVLEQAERWAQRAMDSAEGTDRRIEWLYQTALARLPTPRELKLAAGYVDALQEESEIKRWTDVAHALINTKEFIFIR